MTERKPVVEETGEYYPGMVVASRDQAESTEGGVSTFNSTTGKTSPNIIVVKGEDEGKFFADLRLKLQE